MAKDMSEKQVEMFMKYLDERIKRHNENVDRYGRDKEFNLRTIVKTERAEAEVIRAQFYNILNKKEL